MWRFDENRQIFVFKIGTVIFGFLSSPFQADRTVKQLSIDYIIDHPWGAKVLQKEIYRDDILSGGHSIDEARTKQESVTDLVTHGVFPLKE